MTNHWDEFSKSLAEPLPRRESLRRLGAVFAGAILSPLGLEAAPRPKAPPDPCKAFCDRCPQKKQAQCLTACRACGGNTSRLCGTCGSYFCADLANDVHNCGACGHVCPPPDPYEVGGCFGGTCVYACAPGAADCGDGICTPLWADPDNCGACGNVCGGPNPSCYQGTCSHCTPSCPERWCGGNGCGGVCACPSGTYCESDGWCYDNCSPGLTWCDPGCVDLSSDPYNCGACYHQCAPNEVCAGGFCQGI